MSAKSIAFDWLPQEVLENIGFFTATVTDVGPPSDLLSLILSCKNIHRALSPEANPHLGARIFGHRFDINAAIRRLGPQVATPPTLTKELRKRFVYMKRIRARTDLRIRAADDSESQARMLGELLWFAYLMMLENDEKNVKQLREFAGMEQWLMEYWFDDDSASLASKVLSKDGWPLENEHNSLAMWLFWFFLRPDNFQRTAKTYRTFSTILKPTALAANKYALCHTPWVDFLPSSCSLQSTSISHYSNTYNLTPPKMATPAILSYFSLMNSFLVATRGTSTGLQIPSSLPSSLNQSVEWDTDWQRCINLENAPAGRLSGSYIPGSIQGVWEGIFTYTEFTTYAALLSGRSPSILHNCLVAQHRQTWKLREYYLVASPEADGITAGESPTSLSLGDPLKAFFPPGIRIREHLGCAEIHEPGKITPLVYRPSPSSHAGVSSFEHNNIQDILILGEGHSAWGQFNILGRVRPCDGFISLLKAYVEGDRGRWLYRGYLVGSINGNLSGRWRDTLSLSEADGYEGCFIMNRRN